jgi:hypothetical protein
MMLAVVVRMLLIVCLLLSGHRATALIRPGSAQLHQTAAVPTWQHGQQQMEAASGIIQQQGEA